MRCPETMSDPSFCGFPVLRFGVPDLKYEKIPDKD